MAPPGNNINPSPHQDRGVISESSYGLWNANSCAEPYVDAKDGAAFLRIHPKTLLRLAREASVPAYSFSEGTRRHWRFLISELDTWMRPK